jgi:beta-glucanase (GH16 family)
MKIFAAFFSTLLLFIFVSNVSNAGDWQLVWHDEFETNGAPDPANWDYERGFVRNEEPQWYQPENAFCTNGSLVIEARPEHKRNPDFVAGSQSWRTSREWIDYTSASLITRGLHEFTYGKFEMRARIDTQAGSWPAFWTLGADKANVGWPGCGEIDIMEFYTQKIRANIDYEFNGQSKWSAVARPVSEANSNAWSNAFHVWTMEWNEKKIALLLDGKLMNLLVLSTADQADHGNPFHKPLYLILNQALRSSDTNISQMQFPVRYEIDWVRVYQRTNDVTLPPPSGLSGISRTNAY